MRALPIADGLMEGLERRRAEQEARCRDAGVPFTDDIFVVGDIDGAFMVPRYANQLFRTFVRTFNIGGGKCGLHRLRHTFATELIMSGVNPKTVSNWLGHTDPSFTLKIYVSSSPENLRASVDTVNEVMALPEGYAGQGPSCRRAIPGRREERGGGRARTRSQGAAAGEDHLMGIARVRLARGFAMHGRVSAPVRTCVNKKMRECAYAHVRVWVYVRI